MGMEKFKIKVLQYQYNDESKPYMKISSELAAKYCALHNYEYVLDRTPPLPGRHPYWGIIESCSRNLENCEFLLYLDSDAAIYTPTLTIEEELLPLLADHDILFAADVGHEGARWHPNRPNAGQMLIDNNQTSHDILREWLECHDKQSDDHPVTQRALWKFIEPKYGSRIAVARDYYRFAGRWSHFVRHFYQSSDQSRLDGLCAIAKRYPAAPLGASDPSDNEHDSDKPRQSAQPRKIKESKKDKRSKKKDVQTKGVSNDIAEDTHTSHIRHQP